MNQNPHKPDTAAARRTLRACIQKVATGPEYSKDLSFDEAYAAMRHILSGDADPVQAGVFLIALRMKRETADENAGVLQAILDRCDHATAAVPELLDIADPYDGHVRGLPVAPFLAPLVAACGLPAFSHGLESVGPKNGITSHRVLRAAGVDVERGAAEVAQRLADPAIGWGYCDQQRFCAPLHDLVPLRQRIVKRPLLTTVEVLASPVRAMQHTHLLTGYVHKAYPPVYAALARQAGFHSAAIVRGVEGGVLPSLQQPARLFSYRAGGELQEQVIDPRAIGIEQAQRAVPLPDGLPSADAEDEIAAPIDVLAGARHAADAGLAALRGVPGPARDGLVYAGAIALLLSARHASIERAADAAREAIDSGRALARFEAGS